MRRSVPPREVENLATECAALLWWLKGPGAAARPEDFAAALAAYRALCRAVSYLPRGPHALVKAKALMDPPAPAEQPTTERRAWSFDAPELALQKEQMILTPDGWVVQEPLVPQVDKVRSDLKHSARTDRDALKVLIDWVAGLTGRNWTDARKEHLGRLTTKLSKERARVRANTKPP